MTHFTTGTATIDRELHIVNANQSFYQYIGWENPIFLEQSVFKEDFPGLKESMEAVWDNGESKIASYRVQRQDGSIHWVVADIVRAETEREELIKLNIQSVEDLEQELCALGDDVHELSVYMDIMDELFFRYDSKRDDFCIFMGGERQRMRLFRGSLEMWEKSLTARHPFTDKYAESFRAFCTDLREGTHHFSHEIMLPHLFGANTRELYQLRGRTITDSQERSLVLGCFYTMSKNSHRRKSRSGTDAGRDEMTGLLSKRSVTEYIKSIIDSNAEGNYYLCIVDVDNFKSVNDNFGHMFGDEVLMTVADILKDAVGERGVVGRIGGDEMMIFLENIADRVDLKSILRTIRMGVEWTYRDMKELHLSCSMGAAAWPADVDNYDDLFKLADKMLYLAKENGKNRYIIYTPNIHGDVLHKDTAAVPVVDAGQMKKQNVNKEHLLLEITENFLHRGLWGIRSVMEQTGIAFRLKGVDIFYVEPLAAASHWRADGEEVGDEQLSYTDSTKFRQLFNENNLAVINHTADLEFACPEVYESFNEQHVTAALIYRMEGKVSGYVFFVREDTSSRMWSEHDKAYLNLIGKMIELVIGGR